MNLAKLHSGVGKVTRDVADAAGMKEKWSFMQPLQNLEMKEHQGGRQQSQGQLGVEIKTGEYAPVHETR